MPAAIPDRFRLEVRLGRDGDVEEWLATDTSLDRPVLIRVLGPETTNQRRRQFIDMVGRAAAVSHSHLAKVFMVEEVAGGAYAVVEWTGGATFADQVRAGRNLELAEFLPNATGLASALAALHERGVTHGAIDLSAISYSSAHPAKLSSFGRAPRSSDPTGDVQALASSLETALTGFPPIGPPPSERIDGVSPAIDRIMRLSQSGEMSAAEMERALSAAPTPRAPAPEPRAASRRLLYAAIALVAIAVGLVVIGLFLSGGSTEPALPTRPTTTTSTIPTTSTTEPPGETRINSVSVSDPAGLIPSDTPSAQLAIDRDPDTFWTVESSGPVGLAIAVTGTPRRVELIDLTPGTGFELRWSRDVGVDIDQWELMARAVASTGDTLISVPERSNGNWMIWITALPESEPGVNKSALSEVRFEP